MAMAKAATQAGIQIVTGDTKVVPRGADKIFTILRVLGLFQPQLIGLQVISKLVIRFSERYDW